MSEEKLALRNRIIGLLLRHAREQARRTKQECADALRVSPASITAYEEGQQAMSLPELEVLAYMLDTPIGSFLEEDADLATEEKPLPVQEVLDLRHRIVGVLLRQARIEADMTQEELAELVSCPVGQVSAYEDGQRPIPVTELELLAEHLHVPLEHFLDTQDWPVGEWHREQEAQRLFRELPAEVQEFVTQSANIKFLEVAMRLGEMPAGALRAIAEGLLEITH